MARTSTSQRGHGGRIGRGSRGGGGAWRDPSAKGHISSTSSSQLTTQPVRADKCVCPENVDLVLRLRNWAQFRNHAVTQNMEDRQFWMAAKELCKVKNAVRNEEEAKKVPRIGPVIAGKLRSYMDWRQVESLGPIIKFGRFEARDEKNRWWRIERCSSSTKYMTRRCWGMLDAYGYDECFHTFASAEIADKNVSSAIKMKLKEGYVQVDHDPGDTGVSVNASSTSTQYDGPQDNFDNEGYDDDPRLVREARQAEQNTSQSLTASSRARTKARSIAANSQPRTTDIRAALFEWYEIEDPNLQRRQAREMAEAAASSRGDGVRGREYAPKLLNSAGNVTGVAAMIIALYRAESEQLGFTGFTKHEIADSAQPLCPEVNMRPRNPNTTDFRDGSAHYGAISSLSTTLLKNDIVEPYPIKSKFRLTRVPGKGLISGQALGKRLDAELRRWDGTGTSSNSPPPQSIPHKKAVEILEILDSSDEEDNAKKKDDDDDDDSDIIILDAPPKTSQHSDATPKHSQHPEVEARPNLAPLFSNTTSSGQRFDEVYDIQLVVDSREKRKVGTNECEAMIGCLHNTYHVPRCVKRPLDVADYLWLAQPKRPTNSDWRRECLVLGRAVERKIISDFDSTVRGGTHHTKQRLRMNRCPIAHCIYLVEGDVENIESATNRQVLVDEMAALELLDGFTVHCSQDFNATAAYLKALDDLVRQDYKGKSVSEVMKSADVFPYAKIIKSLDVDPHKWPLKQRWATMLLHVPNVKRDHATAIIEHGKYETPVSLTRALSEHYAPGNPLLTSSLEPGKKRAKLASDIATFFTSRNYTAAPSASSSSAAPPRAPSSAFAASLFS